MKKLLTNKLGEAVEVYKEYIHDRAFDVDFIRAKKELCKTLAVITLIFLVSCAKGQDICTYSQNYVDSINDNFQFEINVLNQQINALTDSIVSGQTIDISDSVNVGDFTLIRLARGNDTLICFDSLNYEKFVMFLGVPPTLQSWTTDSTTVDFVYQPNHVSLRVEKNGEIVIWLKEIRY